MSTDSPATETLPATTLVKICGVTQRDQGLAIAELGVHLIGINLWPSSKRYLALENAAWTAELPDTVQTVGVFVNPDLGYIKEAVSSGLLSFLQLHGDETPEFCAEVQALGAKVIKAFQVRNESTLAVIGDYPVKDILLDAYHPNERGGLGETFPWELALSFKRQYPEKVLYLAGGLTADNVASAVSGVRPYAVDVASGVEDMVPGIKNLGKVKRFLNGAKG